ncbi:MAG: hypothetical protein KBT06_03030 [Prevotellaceae bacterium]|nr:hypothetical protein [Candidatus Colivivens equi]
MTLQSIGSTYLSRSNPTSNFASSQKNEIETWYDAILYFFYAPELTKKYVGHMQFKFNITNCYRTGNPIYDTPEVEDIILYKTTKDLSNIATYSNFYSLSEVSSHYRFADGNYITVGENVFDSRSISWNEFFENGYFLILIQGNGGTYSNSGQHYDDRVTTTKQAQLIVEYSEPTNKAVINSPTEATEKNITAQIPITAYVSSNAYKILPLSLDIVVSQNGVSRVLNGSISPTFDYKNYYIRTIAPEYYFDEGEVVVSYNSNMEYGNPVSTTSKFMAVYPKPYANPEYPIGSAVRASNPIVFSWKYESLRFDSPQKSVKIDITQNGNTQSFSQDTSDTYYQLPSNTLIAGEATYTITVTNEVNQTYTSDPYSFTVIAQSAAPNITSVSQTAIPTVTWETTYQDAYEIRLFDGNTLIYDSDVQIGPDVRSAVIPVMLKNGAYNVQIRALNTYGYYTDWSSYSYVLSTTAPASPYDVRAKVNENYGVEITAFAPSNPGKLYVVRRDENGHEVILGEFIDSFIDYTAKPNTPYEYTVINYNGGRGDGDWIAVRVVMEGVAIYSDDFSDCVKLDKSKDLFEIARTEESTASLLRCLGRTFPVKEGTEWASTIRKFTAFVSDKDMNIIAGIIRDTKAYYKAEKEFFACDVTISDTSNYVNGGKILKFTITRIDEAEVNVL